MLRLFKELQRRNVVKAAISFVVLSYALLEIATILTPIVGLDKSYTRILLIILIVVFPFWLIFAYIYEWTPEGFKQTDKVPEEESLHKATDRKLNHYIIGGLCIIIALLIVDRVFNFSGDIIQSSKENIIVVLPFSHQSQEENDEFFTEGIYDDVIIKLLAVKNFRIISKSVAAEYKDLKGDMKVLGKRFNASYVLTGAVRKYQQQVRITAQLTSTANNQTVWSDEYDAELKNVFELQSNIATEIAKKLQASLTTKEKKDIESVPTKVLSAYEDYLRARYMVNQPRATFDVLQEGVRLLNKAVEADPQFAQAWVLLGQVHSVRYSMLIRDPNRKEEARLADKATIDALERAKKLSPDSWELLSEEGFYLKNVKNDQLGALKAFEKAVEQNPSDAVSMRELSHIYTFLGEPKKSIEVLEKAFKVTQSNGSISVGLTFAYEIMGEYAKMIPMLEKLAEFYPKEKHYLVEAKYYQFLLDGKLSSFLAFKETVENTQTEFPWDERAVKNKEMVVAMFNNEFDAYHEDWKGHMSAHTRSHNEWICPMVANDNINHARLMLQMGDAKEGQQLLQQVKNIVLKPINHFSVCTFDPEVYLPKLDFLAGDKELAKEKLEEIAMKVIPNKSFPTGAVERAVLVQAADLVYPEKAYSYYKQITDNFISFLSFEAICADPWTYPNLIRDPRFIEEVKTDGRFVEFLTKFGFLEG
ncbi:MAG: hypothetical protein HEP71_34550 [Roseivirga sp.]|nr:hypothetical protein [Roseivirga sp.]